MVIDLKYHLTTIIAIFLALGIGILIGSAMIGDDGMVREQQRLIVQIEKDLNILRTQNSQFRTKLSTLDGTITEQNQLIDQLFIDAITGKLSGLRCLLINDPKKGEIKNLLSTLAATGVEVTDFTTLPEKWQSIETASTWDLCLLLTTNIPQGIEATFEKTRICKTSTKNLETKKGLYQLVKSLVETKEKLLSGKLMVQPGNKEGEESGISFDPCLQ